VLKSNKDFMRRDSRVPSRKPLSMALVALAGLSIAVLAQRTPTGRLATLEIPPGLTEVHITFKVGDPDRCLVSDRGSATVDRSAPELAAARWHCARHGAFDRPGGPVLSALDGQRGAWLFVPYRDVADPGLPPVYEALREVPGEPPLPRLRWVQLFTDRVYRGLYLQVTLPGNDFSEEKGLPRIETLATQGADLHCIDRKLRGVCPIYGFLTAESIFPVPTYSAATRQLAALLPAALPRVFLLEDGGPQYRLRPWPLPFDLPAVVANGIPAARDERIARWSEASPETLAVPLAGLPDAGTLRQQLRAALRAGCQVQACDEGDLRRLEESPSLRWLESRGASR
jgi:hypothetical protein